MSDIGVGTKFLATFQDGRPRWRVVKPRGQDVWECVIDEKGYGKVTQVFDTDDIQGSINMEAYYAESENEHEKFWASRKVGETVHYHNGFGAFVRGVIVIDPEDGEKKMRPTGLVGNWRASDLPRITPYGTLDESYHVRQIRDGELMQPNHNNMLEGGYELRADEVDPRKQDDIDLTPPEPTEEQRAAKRYHDMCREVAALLDRDDGNLTPHDAMRKALLDIRQFLNSEEI